MDQGTDWLAVIHFYVARSINVMKIVEEGIVNNVEPGDDDKQTQMNP
jgi:hypothetical protein